MRKSLAFIRHLIQLKKMILNYCGDLDVAVAVAENYLLL